jgi:putative (di)nucleoside polyphosphate hydrolase
VGDRSHDAVTAFVEELLDDPLIQLVMQADRVNRAEARTLLCNAALSVEWLGGAAGVDKEGRMTISPAETEGFRRGVGVILLNRAGQVLIAERIDMPGAWQMPQGAIDKDETSSVAALRELREEIGTDLVEILSETQDWLQYELPPELVGHAWGGRWRGQQQKWFAMLFKGQDSDINIATAHPEFSAWRWASFEDAIALIVPFKRQVYEQVAREFADLALEQGSGPSISTSIDPADPCPA